MLQRCAVCASWGAVFRVSLRAAYCLQPGCRIACHINEQARHSGNLASFSNADFLMMVFRATAAAQNNFAPSVTLRQSEATDSGDHADTGGCNSCHSPNAATWSTSALSKSASDGILA